MRAAAAPCAVSMTMGEYVAVNAEPLLELQSIHPRHFEIEDETLGRRRSVQAQVLLSRGEGRHTQAGRAEQSVEAPPNRLVIVHHGDHETLVHSGQSLVFGPSWLVGPCAQNVILSLLFTHIRSVSNPVKYVLGRTSLGFKARQKVFPIGTGIATDEPGLHRWLISPDAVLSTHEHVARV